MLVIWGLVQHSVGQKLHTIGYQFCMFGQADCILLRRRTSTVSLPPDLQGCSIRHLCTKFCLNDLKYLEVAPATALSTLQNHRFGCCVENHSGSDGYVAEQC